MRCSLIACAQSVIIDRHSNQVSIINLYEKVASSIFPFPFPLYVLAIFEKSLLEPKVISAKIIFEIADQKILNHSFQVVFTSGNMSKVSINLQGLTIPQSGLLELSLLLENEIAAKYSIQVNKNE